MTRLAINLFGKPQISIDGVPVHLPTARAIPLIAYLAISAKSQSREILANLLWADSSQKQALAALRTTLWRLKSAGFEEWISLDRNEIELNQKRNIDIDVVNFKAYLAKCNTHGHPPSQSCIYCTPALTSAVGLYQGDFMAGFNISKAPNFDDWRMQQSEALQTLHLNSLERLVKCHRTMGDFNLAIHYAKLWISYDRLNENAYFQLLQLYSITGQRTAGISLYKHYKDALLREMDIIPAEEITLLYKQLQTGHAPPPSDQRVKNPVFLIAEIENAAQYWAKVGDNNREEIMVTNMNILRDTAHRFGGRVIQRSDESATLLFENGQPLHCAVTIHMKIRKADWGSIGPPNVRMVLYSTFEEGDKPNTFATLTRAASSLLSVSWGGQVVFTDQTLKLLDLPSGALVRDLGFHFIDGIESNVHIYELIHPNLPKKDHPPLQSRTSQIINFPIQTPAFVGREQELEELEQLVKSPDNRMISLIGPGGIGKTRLATQFAAQAAHYFPDGVYFISLASIQKPDFIPTLLAEALKFTFYGPGDQMEQLVKYLHSMKVLLVIDNFEHLRLEGAKLMAILLGRTHQLKIVVTSRERLNMISETILEVHGLPFPATSDTEDIDKFTSVKLFIHNAQRIYPRFPYENNLAEIAGICRQVNGIPLGILLASSWVRVFSCQEIASEIGKNIDFLSSTAPDFDPRHRSLRAVFDQSWELLAEHEQQILRRLSIFSAGFSAHAAQQVCDATQLSLAVFADKSVLYHRQDNRYEMLETFQQYAANKLASDPAELEATKNKYCEYYINFCIQKHLHLNTTDQAAAFNEMTAEIENIRAAWHLMVDLDRWDAIDRLKEPLLAYHVMAGSCIPARELYQHALSKLGRLNEPGLERIRASMLQLSAWMTVKNGFITEGVQGLLESLDILRRCGYPWEVALSLLFLSETLRILGNKTQSRVYIEEALSILQGNSVPQTNYTRAVAAHCQADLGLTLMELGDYDQANENLKASLATHLQIGTRYGTIQPLIGLGRLAFLQGEFLQARNLYLQAMEIATVIYDRRGMALLHNNLGAVYEMIVNISESYHHVNEALKYCKETGDRRLTAVIINNLAFHQMRYLHQPTEAIHTYQESLALFSEIGDLRGITFTCYDISRAYLMVGLVDEARVYCLRSLHTAITLDSTDLILHALHGFVYLLIHLKQLERALRLCYLIIHHTAVGPDTLKRAIVSQVQLEASLDAEITRSAQQWGQSADLADVIDQILTDNKTALV
jgi:predicted ATPase/DNA-binding SARP family transcriptional activator